jgi:phosphatidylserine/phosphatidylglycerophosphate/cardiolipin synthase-like enzyme
MQGLGRKSSLDLKGIMRKKYSRSLIVFLILFCTNVYCAEILGIYFPPYKDAHMPIINLYDGAEKYIHLAIYSLTKDEFAEALTRAHKRGVEVKVLIDRIQAAGRYADDEKLEKAGVELRRSKGSGLMHNKFAVIDGSIIYTGSYNHTDNATTKNDENYIIIKDNDIAETYEKQFQKLWGKHK